MIHEKALLGTIIRDNELIKNTVINENHFEDERHKILFREIKKLVNEGKSADRISLSLSKNIQGIGGISYLNDVISFADETKFEEYEGLVYESWQQREKRNILTRASLEDWDIQRIQTELDRVDDSIVDDGATISELLVDMYEAPFNEGYEEKGAPTGIKGLDIVTNGFMNGDVIIIAARPSVGKTDLMLHFAKQVGWCGYIPVVFSLEMPKQKITTRLIASTGRYNRNKMRNPYKYLTDKQKEVWSTVIGRLSQTNMEIFDKSGQTVAEIRSKTRKVMNKYPGKQVVVFIDYLTLIRPSKFYNGNAHQQVTEISHGLKAMAKDLNIPVICLAQLNRDVEKRQDKRPILSDIRESGSIEQDADVIMFLYRDNYYDKEKDKETPIGDMEIIVAKNRNGATNTVLVKYNKATGEILDEYS